MATPPTSAVDRVLAKLNAAQQADILPLMEAILVDTLVEQASDKMDDASKAAMVDSLGRAIKNVRSFILKIARPQKEQKPTVYE